MINVEKLRKLKGRRIYLFWLDEKTGEITDVTSRDDVIQVIRCKDCKYFETDHFDTFDGVPIITAHEICKRWGEGRKTDSSGYCFMAEAKE